MNDMISHLLTLRNETKGYWAERILSELEYAVAMSRSSGRAHEALLRTTVESIASEHAVEGALTRETVEETEARLQPLAAQAKSIAIVCPAHAHIDMNWLWRFDETVTVTLDTFRTILTLMTEYPAFTFSQSQASAYRIVEEHDPEMLKEIRKRVKEGRWEVTASTWVEADKNMPSGESLARHALYTKRYLCCAAGHFPGYAPAGFRAGYLRAQPQRARDPPPGGREMVLPLPRAATSTPCIAGRPHRERPCSATATHSGTTPR